MPVLRWRSGVASGLRALADRLESIGEGARDTRGRRGAGHAVTGLVGGGTPRGPAGLDLAGAPAHWLDRLLAAGVITAGPGDDGVGPRDPRPGEGDGSAGLPGSAVERPPSPDRSPSGHRRGPSRPRLRLPVRPLGDGRRIPGPPRFPGEAPDGRPERVLPGSAGAPAGGARSRSMPRLRLPGSDAGSAARSSSRDRRPIGRDVRVGATRERAADQHDARAPLRERNALDTPVNGTASGAAGRGEAPPPEMPRGAAWRSRERTGAHHREAVTARGAGAQPVDDGGLATSRETVVDAAGQGGRGVAAGGRASHRPPAPDAEPHAARLPADAHRGTRRAGYADRIPTPSRVVLPSNEPRPRPMGEPAVAPPTARNAIQKAVPASRPDTRDPWPELPARPADPTPALPRVELALARAVRLVHEQAAV